MRFAAVARLRRLCCRRPRHRRQPQPPQRSDVSRQRPRSLASRRARASRRCVSARVAARATRRRVQWLLKRNCSITPRQLLGVYLSLCALSLAIAGGFWWHGAPLGAAVRRLELLLSAPRSLVYARHAADRERITLAGPALTVEHRCGRRVERGRVPRRPGCASSPLSGDRSLIELSGEGQRIARRPLSCGPSCARALADELRAALRCAPAAAARRPERSNSKPRR